MKTTRHLMWKLSARLRALPVSPELAWQSSARRLGRYIREVHKAYLVRAQLIRACPVVWLPVLKGHLLHCMQCKYCGVATMATGHACRFQCCGVAPSATGTSVALYVVPNTRVWCGGTRQRHGLPLSTLFVTFSCIFDQFCLYRAVPRSALGQSSSLLSGVHSFKWCAWAALGGREEHSIYACWGQGLLVWKSDIGCHKEYVKERVLF